MGNLIKVLSIDGGGIRGIIPAMVLAAIEQRTGKPIAQLFDLVAGTSTGGILALGLTVPDGRETGGAKYKAQELVDLYEKQGPTIFRRSRSSRFLPGVKLVQPKYPADGIETVLAQYFGDTMLSSALCEVLVSSYVLEWRRPYFFKRRKARGEGEDYPMRQVARATSAAPTYFKPTRLPMREIHQDCGVIDGGVFANNPAMCAYAEASRHLLKAPDDSILIVSLGTGELNRSIAYNKAKGWGLVSWASPILDVVFDGVHDSVDYQLTQLLPRADDGPRYYRFQVELSEGSDDLDDVSPDNLNALKRHAGEIIRDERLAEICERLQG